MKNHILSNNINDLIDRMCFMKKNDNYYWKVLDNVATFYASTTTNSNPNIYRLSIKLKEKVKSKILDDALHYTLIAVPSFNVKLRRGVFWYYLDYNNEKPIIREDDHFPHKMINNINNNYFLFRVTYFGKRINVDFSHILTDGVGALSFLEILVTNYLKLSHPKKIKQDLIAEPELLSLNEMNVDSFLKYSRISKSDRQIIKERSQKSYILINNNEMETINVIIGTISITSLKNITKQKNVTITAYLTATLIYAIYHSHFKYEETHDPIVIAIPVNLRNYFPSYSMNNFFSTILVGIDVMKQDYTFDDLLQIVTTKMKNELDTPILLEKFRVFVNLQKNIVLRFIPLFIKDILLKNISRIVSDHGSTTSLSNLGIVNIKDEIKEYIEKVDMIAYTDNILPIKVGMASFNDNLSISFSSVMNDTEIERLFFTFLTNQGIEVKITASIDTSIKEATNEIL
jgi:NRPS condensation-like uncharacterized protein